MRARETIENEGNYKLTNEYVYWRVQIELLLDIRDLLSQKP